MGSFAATCAISHLPVHHGDPVRFILLTQSPYDTAVWHPRTWPIRALYNDYGSIEEVESGPLRDVILVGLHRDIDEPPVPETFDALLEALREQRVYVAKDLKDSDLLPVRQAMIREDVYQALLRFMVQGSKPGTYKTETMDLSDYQADVARFASAYHAGDELRRLCIADTIHIGSRWIAGDEVPFVLGLASHARMLLAMSPTLPSCIAEFSLILDALFHLRHAWQPQDHSQPQFGDWAAHAQFHAALAQIAEEQHAMEQSELE